MGADAVFFHAGMRMLICWPSCSGPTTASFAVLISSCFFLVVACFFSFAHCLPVVWAFSAIDLISFSLAGLLIGVFLVPGGSAECARLVFDVPVKRMLNSNQRLHPMTKAARSKWLRGLASERGVTLFSGSGDGSFLFDGPVEVTVTVCPTTRSRMDPPNVYPSVKALVDGLTDAGWWEDDHWRFLPLMRFTYGGRSPVKGCYRLIVDVRRCGDAPDVEALEVLSAGAVDSIG